jgi:hypothetical protein
MHMKHMNTFFFCSFCHFPVLGFSNTIPALGGWKPRAPIYNFLDKLVQAVISAEKIMLDGEWPEATGEIKVPVVAKPYFSQAAKGRWK